MTVTRLPGRPPCRSVSVASGLERYESDPKQRSGTIPRFSPAMYRQRQLQTHRRSFILLLLICLLVPATLFLFFLRKGLYHWPFDVLLRTRNGRKQSQYAQPRLIAFITDLDRDACRDYHLNYRRIPCGNANVWVSYYKRALLKLSAGKVEWVDKFRLESRTMSNNGMRAMELSELIFFGDHLLAPDDRTGVLFEILSPRGSLPKKYVRYAPSGSDNINPSTLRRAVLDDGDGTDRFKAFKSEWSVVKDRTLIIGGHGRPVTTSDGKVSSTGPLWVKTMPHDFSAVKHLNWTAQYNALNAAAGVAFPGYLMHEAVLWSSIHREWVFLPRRRSTEAYSSADNEKRGWNGLLIASEDFSHVRVQNIPQLLEPNGFRGFSSAKFVPGSDDRVIAALRTVEIDPGNHGYKNRYTETFISVFNIVTGETIMKETRVGYKKYEGLVFL